MIPLLTLTFTLLYFLITQSDFWVIPREKNKKVKSNDQKPKKHLASNLTSTDYLLRIYFQFYL